MDKNGSEHASHTKENIINNGIEKGLNFRKNHEMNY